MKLCHWELLTQSFWHFIFNEVEGEYGCFPFIAVALYECKDSEEKVCMGSSLSIPSALHPPLVPPGASSVSASPSTLFILTCLPLFSSSCPQLVIFNPPPQRPPHPPSHSLPTASCKHVIVRLTTLVCSPLSFYSILLLHTVPDCSSSCRFNPPLYSSRPW